MKNLWPALLMAILTETEAGQITRIECAKQNLALRCRPRLLQQWAFLRTAVSSGLMVREQPHGLTCGARLLYESFDEHLVRDRCLGGKSYTPLYPLVYR